MNTKSITPCLTQKIGYDVFGDFLFTLQINDLYKDAFNIFVPPQYPWRGSAMGAMINHCIFYHANEFPENPGILVHEMGHALGLRHTFESYDKSFCEAVTRDSNDPNYNADCAGDHVTDTNAMPEFETYNNNHPIDANCNYTGAGIDCYGTPFTITEADVKNYMGYVRQDCRQVFTTGQKIRMRETLIHPNPGGGGYPNNYSIIIESNPVDLVIYDSADDLGLEPNNITNVIWHSTDIWARNQPDGFVNQQHQDLYFTDYYHQNQIPAYVYVRVTNKSCVPFSGNGDLKLYWAKGGLTQIWDSVWTGSSSNGLPTGGEVGTQTIPALAPEQSTILEFSWLRHDPDEYENVGFLKPWMFCFLARVVSPEDPMSFPEGTNVALNTRNNNNIAYKNATLINISVEPIEASVFAGNLANPEPITADIRFFTTNPEDGRIWDEAEVNLALDEGLWDRWQQGGEEAANIDIVNEEERIIRLVGNNARLNNLSFDAGEWDILTLSVNFLIDEVDIQENYSLHVEQILSDSQEATGGFTYQYQRDSGRPAFQADVSSNIQGNTLELTADDINEHATYNWYDTNGDLVHTGKNYSLSDSISETYQLEVIAETDGHKDYYNINTNDLRKIQSISPNPASSDVTVGYFVGNSNSAYLRIVSVSTGSQNNYLINTQNTTQAIDLNAYPTGAYIVSLVCEGNILDSKNLIIE